MLESFLGLVTGLAIGMTGVGGGVLVAPLLILVLHRPASESIGTALLFSTVVKLLAISLYVKRGQADWGVLRLLLMGGVPGAIVGPLLLRQMGKARWEGPVLLIVGLTIVATAGLALFRWQHAEKRAWDGNRALPWLAFPIGLEVGFSSAGAGALGSVLLFRFTALQPSTIVGTDLLFGLALSACGGGMHAAAGNWTPDLLVHLLTGGLPGAIIGAALGTRLRAQTLRTCVLGWAAAMGALLVRQGLIKVVSSQ